MSELNTLGGQPLLFRRYLDSFVARKTDGGTGDDLFRALPSVDFCRDMLQFTAGRLRVLEVPPCG